jgi:hypothetical protein
MQRKLRADEFLKARARNHSLSTLVNTSAMFAFALQHGG